MVKDKVVLMPLGKSEKKGGGGGGMEGGYGKILCRFH